MNGPREGRHSIKLSLYSPHFMTLLHAAETKRVARGERAAGATAAKGMQGTQSIQRAFATLREIATHNPHGLTLPAIATGLGVEEGTARRIVKGLVHHGMLFRDAATRCYKLGHLVYELGLAAGPSYPLRELLQPSLRRLADKTGDSVFLMVRSGLDAVCLDREQGSFPIQAHTLDVGSRRPLGMGGGGLALLLEMDDAEIARILVANESRYALFDRPDLRRLRAAVKRSREAGYAVNDQDIVEGIAAIGVAIPAPDAGESVPAYAAVSVAAIASRLTGPRRDEVAKLLRREAKTMSRLMSAQGGWL